MEELEEGKNQGLPLQTSRVWAESNPGRLCACRAYVRCWDQFSVPQNKELCYRPQAQQSIVQHCMAAGKSQLQAYKRTSASHCKHALVRGSQKQNPRGVRACGRTGKIPVVTHKNSFSKTGFLLSWSSLCRQSGLTQRSILPVS